MGVNSPFVLDFMSVNNHLKYMHHFSGFKIFFLLISSGRSLSSLRLTQGVLNLSRYVNTFMQLICKEICEEKALPKWRAYPAGGLKG